MKINIDQLGKGKIVKILSLDEKFKRYEQQSVISFCQTLRLLGSVRFNG